MTVNRIEYLDLLRGFALFGILVSNLPVISDPPFGLTLNETEWSYIAKFLISFLITGKFFLLFSFVFGYGFTILLKSLQRKGLPARNIFFRRIIGLFVLGILHAVFFFYGDILVSYAIMGSILFMLREMPARRLFITAAILWAVSAILYGVIGYFSSVGVNEGLSQTLELTNQSLADFRGDFLSATYRRFVDLPLTFGFILAFNWPSAMMMFFVGLYFGNRNLLHDPQSFFDTVKKYNKLAMLAAVIFNTVFAIGQITTLTPWLSMLSYASLAPGSVALSILWAYWLYRLSSSGFKPVKAILSAMSASGKMSLTNYILQSVLLSFIFNGWGYNLYGRLPLELAILWVVPVYSFNLAFSKVWLHFFAMGPLEIILRKFTYLGAAEK